MINIKEHTFKENHRAFVDFYNHIMGNELYDYDNQNIKYDHLKDLLNHHFPKNSLSFEFMVDYFLNRGVLIGFTPIAINGECSMWSAIGITHDNILVCNDFYNWKDAFDKCIEYGFQLLNGKLLSTKNIN